MSTPPATPLTAGTRRLIPLRNHVLPWVVAALFLLVLPAIFDYTLSASRS